MSRFVAAGADPDSGPLSTENDESWAKARRQIADARSAKSLDQGKQEDGKSLYEVLQANKAAKQEAFEEATKLRNQFRALDDAEIEFLDSVREKERDKEDAVRQETAQHLDDFHRQRASIEQQALQQQQQQKLGAEKEPQKSWAANRKRRRIGTTGDIHPATKLQKVDSAEQTKGDHEPEKKSTTSPLLEKIVEKASGTDSKASIPNPKDEETLQVGLGLAAYDSEEDSDS